jgi:pyrroloquinoline quinone biosynthesis protein B
MAWSRDPRAIPRTQSSLAVSSDGQRWILLNASPDLRQQIASTPALQPRSDGPLRNSPIKAVVLTNADVDHVAGLLSLRERQALTVYGTSRVLGILAANAIFNVLDPKCVARCELRLDEPMLLSDEAGDLGLAVEPFSVPGKVALYLEMNDGSQARGTRSGDTIGLKVHDPTTGRSFYYIPGCAAMDAALAERLRGAALVVFDGTLFEDNELVALGLSDKTGQRMGHISMSGADGSIAAFETLGVARRIYVHMNTSNPALIEGSPERTLVERAGWEIAADGMEVKL